MTWPEFIYTVVLKPRPLRAIANAGLRALIPEKIMVHGAVVFLNPADPVVSGALALGVYEREEINFLIKNLKKESTFVDVGANGGLYSALAAGHGVARVLAIEPHAETLQYLRKTLALCTGSTEVFLEPCAAGARAETMTLYSNSQNKGDNRLYPDPLLDRREEVSVETLDALCERNGISSIDFLKIDVQGAELKVIQGGEKVLSGSSDCTILTEFWPDGLRRCGSDPEEYLELLAGRGFILSELAGNGNERPVDPGELIESTQGRQYKNLIARRQK